MTIGVLLLAAVAVRNPFWPIGFDGPLESISAEPRISAEARATANTTDDTTTAAAAAAAAELAQLQGDANNVKPRHWIEARKNLHVTGRTTMTAPDGTQKQCAIINGYSYANGDLISVTHEGRRFTWRVAGLTQGDTLRLLRVRARHVKETPPPSKEKEKTK